MKFESLINEYINNSKRSRRRSCKLKIVAQNQLNHIQLMSEKTKEIYSFSAIVSQLLGSKQLFIHHDIITPGQKSSGPHRHTIIEEVVYILKGTATVVEGVNTVTIGEGSFAFFDPQAKELHYLVNQTQQNIETLTFSIQSDLDSVVFDQSTCS